MDVAEAAAVLRTALPSVPRTAVVLGSGMGEFEEAIEAPVEVSFDDVPGLPSVGVAGHRGRFVYGRIGRTPVLLQAGRFHAYEGHPLGVVVAPTRILAALGVDHLITTNASGGIHALFEPGDLVLLDDHINVTFRGPFAGPVARGEARFMDMSTPFDPALVETVRASASDLGIPLHSGTYAWVLGPSYETAAEIRMLAKLGAHVVGMSTAPEVLAAAAGGLRCAAVSLVTNRAAGLAPGPLSHTDVLDVGARAASRMRRLLVEVVRRLHGAVDGGSGDQPPATAK